MEISFRHPATASVLLLLGLALTAVAHEDGTRMDMEMDMDMDIEMDTGMSSAQSTPSLSPFNASTPNSTMGEPINYFRHPEYSYLMLTHIALMTVGWVFVLPLGVMLSITHSRLRVPVQFSFFVTNAAGIILAIIYNRKTPDLYPHNAHHSIGWVLTGVTFAQTCMALITSRTRATNKGDEFDGNVPFLPISSQAMVEHHWLHDSECAPEYRFSNDSGHGTERNTASLRSQSLSSLVAGEATDSMRQKYESNEENNTACESTGKQQPSLLNRLDIMSSKKIHSYVSSGMLRSLRILEATVTRTVLILGFMGLTTGIVTYAGIFQGREVFSGLAHFIKGGVFFWLGILTLGRWAGSFADLGWAWNIKPPASVVGSRKANMVSAEFVESFLIFFYGSTNVFLEHLSAWGKAWSAQDMEHMSISIMFIGGGLCGMFIESTKIRELLNSNITQALGNDRGHSSYEHGEDGDTSRKPPQSYRVSMNPLPALILLLLGMMMSSHNQKSMVSTMVHKQWGTLLMGASFARTLTYIIFYLSPPTSLLPSRPPSELITAFCLMAGGVVMMASSRDTVLSIEYNDLNVMFAFTVTMGLVSFLMTWIIFTIAVKGWALRKQGRAAF